MGIPVRGEGCKSIEKYFCLVYTFLWNTFDSIKKAKQDLENALAEHLWTIYFCENLLGWDHHLVSMWRSSQMLRWPLSSQHLHRGCTRVFWICVFRKFQTDTHQQHSTPPNLKLWHVAWRQVLCLSFLDHQKPCAKLQRNVGCVPILVESQFWSREIPSEWWSTGTEMFTNVCFKI